MSGDERLFMSPNDKGFLEELIRTELILKSIYEQFAKKFIDHSAFWEKMAKDELFHAQFIKKATTLFTANKKEILIKSEIDRIAAINDKLQRLEFDLRKEDLTMFDALKKAILLEQSSCESHYHETLDVLSANEYGDLFDKLKEYDKAHIETLKVYLKEFKDKRF